jgi:hypothetical protein
MFFWMEDVSLKAVELYLSLDALQQTVVFLYHINIL